MNIFLYGTLLYPPLFTLVSGQEGGQGRSARLADHQVVSVVGGSWPALRSVPGMRAEGRLISDVSAEQLRRLDAYERPFGYQPTEVEVEIEDGARLRAIAYLPQVEDPMADGIWSLSDWQRDHAAVALLAAAEVDWSNPDLDAASLRHGWNMVRARAASSLRAGSEALPASLRHQPQPGDWSVRSAGPMSGAFFRFAPLRLSHRRFDGGTNADLPREVMVGVDAAMLLPYDVGRDRVMLVEQFRSGPARRGDANPWALEPVAGMVDADEEPEAAALREAVEEAHLTEIRPIKMFQGYASPGNSTDFFHLYLGLTDLLDGHPSFGGLAEEAEDIRLHILPFAAALDLVETGEINVLPLVAMLKWLEVARPALRAGHQSATAGVCVPGTRV